MVVWLELKRRNVFFAAAGGQQEALDIVDRLASKPLNYQGRQLELDPRWDVLRDEPRFSAFINVLIFATSFVSRMRKAR